MPNTNLEIMQRTMEDFKKFRSICYWLKKKIQLKHMRN